MKLKLLVTTCLLAFYSIIIASTTVPSVITTSQVWDVSGSPYLINGNVLLNQGLTVEVKPGVSIISSGQFKFTVNGTLKAIGKADSVILIKGLSIYFSDSSVDFNPATYAGCQFKNCAFRSPTKTSSISAIILDRTHLSIDYCNFDSISYPIQGSGSGDSVNLYISNSNFQGDAFGYLIYGLRQKSFLSFTNNAIYNFGQISLPEASIIQYCYFYGLRYYPSINDYGYAKVSTISCNYFKNGNFPYTPAIDLSTTNTGGRHIIIQNNEFDSMQLFINMPCTYVATDTVEVTNNDFLHYTYKVVSYSNCFSGTGTYHTVDFTNNFWNTTDTTLIKNAIYDFRNNSKVPYKIDFSNFKTSAVSNCWPLSPGDAPKKQNTGIGKSKKSISHFAIFPNPASSKLQIETDLDGNLTCEIIDITGRQVSINSIINTQSDIDVSALKPGIYYISLHSEKGTSYVLKFVKE